MPHAASVIATTLVVLALASVPAPGSAQDLRLRVPERLRSALVGCWSLPEGEVHEISEHRAGLVTRYRAPARGFRERPVLASATLEYDPRSDAVFVHCGPRTQHGQICRFRLERGRVRASLIERGSVPRELEIRPCGPSTVRPRPRVVVPVPVDASPARLLGARRVAVDAGRQVTGEDEGWVRYGDDVAVFYEAGLAMRVRARIDPAAIDCIDALRRAGLEPTGAPLRRRDGCEWPGTSARHRAARGVGARVERDVVELWRIVGR